MTSDETSDLRPTLMFVNIVSGEVWKFSLAVGVFDNSATVDESVV